MSPDESTNGTISSTIATTALMETTTMAPVVGVGTTNGGTPPHDDPTIQVSTTTTSDHASEPPDDDDIDDDDMVIEPGADEEEALFATLEQEEEEMTTLPQPKDVDHAPTLLKKALEAGQVTVDASEEESGDEKKEQQQPVVAENTNAHIHHRVGVGVCQSRLFVLSARACGGEQSQCTRISVIATHRSMGVDGKFCRNRCAWVWVGLASLLGGRTVFGGTPFLGAHKHASSHPLLVFRFVSLVHRAINWTFSCPRLRNTPISLLVTWTTCNWP
jgi:hypothetical protein